MEKIISLEDLIKVVKRELIRRQATSDISNPADQEIIAIAIARAIWKKI